MNRIVHIGESDMRRVPALQAADLLAYCVGNKDSVRFAWQEQVLNIDRLSNWYDYDELNQDFDMATHIWNISRYKFPRRGPTP
jgi:hypothetical protein